MTRPRDPSPLIDLPRLLTPAETAEALKVDAKHVLREAHLKNIRRTCTPGGTTPGGFCGAIRLAGLRKSAPLYPFCGALEPNFSVTMGLPTLPQVTPLRPCRVN